MSYRSLLFAAVVPFCLLAGCNDDNDTTGTVSIATVRFINVTGTNIDVTNAGLVGTGNGNLGFGATSACIAVATTGTGIAFTQAGTTVVIPGFTPSFVAGGNYTVIAYPTSSGTQFAVIDNTTFVPTSGQAGLRIFNAASGSGGLVVLGGGTALGTGTGVAFGTAGSFINVNAGSQAITFNTGSGTTVVANAGTLSFTAGQRYTLVVAPAAAGSTTLRTVLVTGC